MRELTPEVAAALERFRVKRLVSLASSHMWLDMYKLADTMLDLYPPGHDDEITPERLVACGGKIAESTTGTSVVVDLGDNLWVLCVTDRTVWILDSINIPDSAAPRNMGEVWELLDRLGIEWRTKGGV